MGNPADAASPEDLKALENLKSVYQAVRTELAKVEETEYRLEQRLVLKEEVTYEPRWETVTTRETLYRPVTRTTTKKRTGFGVQRETTYEPGPGK